MVAKGLKVGDTFTDGRTFVIDKVNEDGSYISHVVPASSITKAPPKKKGEANGKD